MKKQNLYLTTTITTIIATIVYVIVEYLLSQSFECKGTIVFAIVFWLCFFLGQKWFGKRQEKKNNN